MYQYDKRNGKKSSKWSDELARPKMALKTVLKGLLGTYGILSPELVNAYENDNETEFVSNSNRTFTDVEAIVQDEPQTEPKKVQI